MQIEWSDKEQERLRLAHDGAESAATAAGFEPTSKECQRRTAVAVASCAVELAAARGVRERGSWSEDLALAVDGGTRDLRISAAKRLSHDLVVQGATVATLRAKVERDKAILDASISAREGLKGEVTALRSEVERLKGELVTQHNYRKLFRDRANAAESRLAAIRERTAKASAELRHAYRAIQNPGAQIDPNLVARAIRILETLEGDAPQEATHVPVLPGDFALSCSACGDVKPHRWKPSPEAGDFWRCSECGEPSTAGRYPCSPTCSHPDAATPGHPERVKQRSEAWEAMHPNGSCTCAGDGTCAWCDRESKETYYDRGAEDMRAACWEIVQTELRLHGWGPGDGPWTRLKAAIEGAAP